MVLARERAVKGAKRQFQAQGLKPQRMAWKEIAAAGDVYLANHRELIAEAKRLCFAGTLRECLDQEEASEFVSAGRAKSSTKSTNELSEGRPSNND
jgi:hypothetical protein